MVMIINHYGAYNDKVDYALMSKDLGMHVKALQCIKSSQSKVQTMQRLRNLYSSCE